MIQCDIQEFFEQYDSVIAQHETIRPYECEECGLQYCDVAYRSDPPYKNPKCECGGCLEPIILGFIGIVKDREPTTVGQLGERNYKKLSKNKLSYAKQYKEDKLKEKRKNWYNPKGEDLSFIKKMTPKQKMEYIKTGKK